MPVEKDSHSLHISQQFNSELEGVKTHLLEMGGLVEKQVSDAVACLIQGDSALAQQVRDNEKQVDKLEVMIDEECQRIIARRQPAASDLRLVIAISKIITDLERMSDEAAKIAKQAIVLIEEGISPRGYVEVRHIGQHVHRMIHDALDAFVRLDVELALQVAQEDKLVDQEYDSAMRALVTYMMEDARSISRVLSIIWALRSLERIGDHARNVCEHLIYLIKGQDVRHLGLKEMARRVRGE